MSEKSADFSRVATRLDNLEQKVSGSGTSIGNKLERLYSIVVGGAQSGTGTVNPVTSKNVTVFDDEDNFTSFYGSVFGQADGGGPSNGVKTTLPTDGGATPGVPFYSQVFAGDPLFKGTCLQYTIFGGTDEVGGFAAAFQEDNPPIGKGFAAAVFGTTTDLAAFYTTGKSLLRRVEDLEDAVAALESRTTIIESDIVDLNVWKDTYTNDMNTALATIRLRLDNCEARLTAGGL